MSCGVVHRMLSMNNELLIFIPTYNERKNVESVLSQILKLGLPADILFVDDNSPDGTGQLLDSIAAGYSNVFIQQRDGKPDIGCSHAYAIRWARGKGYRLLMAVNCDIISSPECISDLLAKADEADVVVSSPQMQSNGLSACNPFRRLLARVATRSFLHVPFDATGVFRLYRLDRIPWYFLDAVHSLGEAFLFESLYVLHLNGYRVVQIPPSKTCQGNVNARVKNAIYSPFYLIYTYFATLFNRERYEIAEPFRPESLKEGVVDPQNWDGYWSAKDNKPTLLLYDLIAAFYRKFIIKPTLNHFILSNFNAESRLLHAGCGSGQVDRDIGEKIGISALDISPAALSIYKKANKHYCELIHGSIFDMPVPDNSFDGIYNLGVMEHFTEEEIAKILLEFNRVLKQGGKIVLFWPPEFGLSVMVLKFAHFVLNRVLKKNIFLHPAEITRVRSRRQIEGYLKSAGFRLIRYSFGIRDLFAHVVVIGEKMPSP